MSEDSILKKIFDVVVVAACIVLLFLVWLAMQWFMYVIGFWSRF